MSRYPMFQEIINEIKARPEADPVGILEEYIAPLVDACNEINDWIGQHPTFDFNNEPEWYYRFVSYPPLKAGGLPTSTRLPGGKELGFRYLSPQWGIL